MRAVLRAGTICIIVCAVIGGLTTATAAATPGTQMPEQPVKLVFIHHSTGENWLSDSNGELGKALRDNNYFVSDTNYGWGPDSIGSHTDIGDWWTWFRGPDAPTYLAVLYNESGQLAPYSRLDDDPGGVNRIVLFKSCFPNSNLGGNPGDPVPAIESNLLKGLDCGSSSHTVANAKGIYIDLLDYFATRPDTLFVVVTAPPVTATEHSANARSFNQWLVNDWLAGYGGSNVFVFDFYNVLTTNGGDPDKNDLGWTTGNHHRWLSGTVQHQVDLAFNTSAYPTGDDHPSPAGNRKATGEFVPLLNFAYNRWTAGRVPAANFTANVTAGQVPLAVLFTDTSTGGPDTWAWTFGDGNTSAGKNPVHVYTSPGVYTVNLTAANENGSDDERKDAYIVVGPVAAGKIGVYSGGTWYRDLDGNGLWTIGDRASVFGAPGWDEVIGDWNGNQATEIGVFLNGSWYLDLDGDGIWTTADGIFSFGRSGWNPVVGDWSGDLSAEIGVYRDGTWYRDLDGDGTWDSNDLFSRFGMAGWDPVVGDWNGDLSAEIGVYRDGTWYRDLDGDGTWDSNDLFSRFGMAGWDPVVGDWDGDLSTEIGVYRDGTWYLDLDGDGGWDTGDVCSGFGMTGWDPVVGDWNGDLSTEIGVYRDGAWYLDLDNDHTWGTGDFLCRFGMAGWKPVVGTW